MILKQETSALAPIALFAYKRPAHTRRLLESICQNPEFSSSPVFVFSDAAKSPQDEDQVLEVRKILKDYETAQTRFQFAEKNKGLAASIISGVTELVEKYGRVIVLEDDLILSPHFLRFMNQALVEYANDEKVMHISGYMYPIGGDLPETLFYRNCSSWGWATWQRAWKKFEPDPKRLLNQIDREHLRFYFDIEGAADFYQMLKLQNEGRIDSWAIRWDATVALCKGLSLYAGGAGSLVVNGGLDGSGSHCEETSTYDSQIKKSPIQNFSKEIVENEEMVKRMSRFYRSSKPSVARRVVRRLKRLVS